MIRVLKKLGGRTLATTAIAFGTSVLGVFAGMFIESVNTEIGLCAASTSGRYIHDGIVRQTVCPDHSQ